HADDLLDPFHVANLDFLLRGKVLEFAYRADAFTLLLLEAANVDVDELLGVLDFANHLLALVLDRFANGDVANLVGDDRHAPHDATGPLFHRRHVLATGMASATLVDAGHAHGSANRN